MKRYFRLLGQSCRCFGNDAGFSIVSVENDDSLNFSINTLKGMHISRDGVLALLQKCYKRELSIALNVVKNSIKYKKIKRIIDEGSSGVKDLYLSSLEEIACEDGIYYRKTKHVITITCADKIGNAKIYLPDLIVFLPYIFEENDDLDRIKIIELKQIDTSKYEALSEEEEEIINNYIGEIEGIHSEDEER